MTPLIAASAAVACLLLTLAIHGCNILSRPGSVLRSELLTMIVLALLVAIFPVALVGSAVLLASSTGIVDAAARGVFDSYGPVAGSFGGWILTGVALTGVALTVLSFRQLLRATYRPRALAQSNVTPLPPRPEAPAPSPAPRKLAA